MKAQESLIHSLGEVHQEEIKAADVMARALLASDEPRAEVKLQLPGGGEIKGVAFRKGLIITDEFIATTNIQNKIGQFLPRR